MQEKYELRSGCNTTLFRVLRANSTHQFTLEKEEERKRKREARGLIKRKCAQITHLIAERTHETSNSAYKTMTQILNLTKRE